MTETIQNGLFEILGGRGSGHHGHAGRPGKRGGSSSKSGRKASSSAKTDDGVNREVRKHRVAYDPEEQAEMSLEDRAVLVAEDIGTKDKTVAKNLAYSIGYYTDSPREIRRQTTEYHKALYNDIQTYIDKSPKWGSGLLLRGAPVRKSEFDKLLKKGNIVDMKGLSSWTSSISCAKDFADQKPHGDSIPVIFRMPKGTMNGASISHLSWIPEEREILVGKRAKLKVVSTGRSRVFPKARVVTVEDVG